MFLREQGKTYDESSNADIEMCIRDSQIMLRIAGVDWNGMTHTTAGTWGTVPTMGAFAGGADGPFAYFINNSAIFGKAAHTGGIFTAKSLAVNDPSPTGTDPILARTERDGVSLSCVLTSTTSSIFVQSVSGCLLYTSRCV